MNEIIYDAAKLGVQKIAFSGGEPLSWSTLCNVIHQCQGLGIETTIYTTGTCSVDAAEDLEVLIKKLKKSGLNRAIFSLYGSNSQKHNYITRISGSFDNTVKAIKLFGEYSIHCELHFVPLKSTYRELSGLIDLAISLGIKRISLLRFVPRGRGSLLSESEPLSKDENLELKNAVINRLCKLLCVDFNSLS